MENEFVYFTFDQITTKMEKGKEAKILKGMPAGWQTLTLEKSKEVYDPKKKSIGLLTGKVSNITVIDFDDIETYKKVLLEYPELEDCYKVKTNKGYHLYFKYHEDFINKTNIFKIPGVDCRNDGGFVIAPGTSYKLLNNTVVKYEVIPGDIVDIPASIFDLINDEALKSQKVIKKPTAKQLKAVMEPCGKKKVKYAPDALIIKDHLDMLNKNRASDYSDWIKIGWALYNELGAESSDLFHYFSEKSSKYDKDAVDKYFATFKDKTETGYTLGTIKFLAKKDNPAAYIAYNKIDEKLFFNKMKDLNHLDIAEYYKEENKEDQKYIFCNDQWFKYNEFNIIEKLGSNNPSCLFNDIAKTVQNDLKVYLKRIEPETKDFEAYYKIFKVAYKAAGTDTFINGVIKFLKGLYTDKSLEDNLDNNHSLLCFTNVLYDYNIKAFRQIKKTDYVSFNTNYNAPTKSNPEIKKELVKLLKSIFDDDAMIKYWLQSVSMAAFTNKFENFYIHTGSGGNGKGVLFSLLKYCFGDYYRMADSEFLSTKFKSDAPNSTLANSKGKRFFVVSEPSLDDRQTESKLNVAFIKYITGQDEVSCRDLYTKNKNTFKPLFTVFMQCNDKPGLSNIDKGILRRLKIVDYPFNFVTEVKKPTDKLVDTNLKDKLKNQDYINEFMLMLLDAAASGALDEPVQIKEAVANYALENDPVQGWLLENYEILTSDVEKKDRIKTSILQDQFANNKLTPAKFNQFLKLNGVNLKTYSGYLMATNIKPVDPEQEDNL